MLDALTREAGAVSRHHESVSFMTAAMGILSASTGVPSAGLGSLDHRHSSVSFIMFDVVASLTQDKSHTPSPCSLT